MHYLTLTLIQSPSQNIHASSGESFTLIWPRGGNSVQVVNCDAGQMANKIPTQSYGTILLTCTPSIHPLIYMHTPPVYTVSHRPDPHYIDVPSDVHHIPTSCIDYFYYHHHYTCTLTFINLTTVLVWPTQTCCTSTLRTAYFTKNTSGTSK